MARASLHPLQVVGLATLVEGGMILVALAGGWLLNLSPLAAARPSWGALGAGVVATVPLVLGLAWSVRTRVAPMARLARQVEEKVVPLFAACSVGHLAAIALLAGIGEELLFRGLVQTATAQWAGPWTGLLVASAAFGLAHPVTPLYAVLAGAIGLYLGGLFLVTENLLVPAIAHALYDFVALGYVVSRSARRGAGAVGPEGPGRQKQTAPGPHP